MLVGLRPGGSGAWWQELHSAWSASPLNALNRKETRKSLDGTRTSIWLKRWLVGRTWSGNQVTNGPLTSRRTKKEPKRTVTLYLRWRLTEKCRRTKMMERASLTVSIESLALSTISMYTTSLLWCSRCAIYTRPSFKHHITTTNQERRSAPSWLTSSSSSITILTYMKSNRCLNGNAFRMSLSLMNRQRSGSKKTKNYSPYSDLGIQRASLIFLEQNIPEL